MSDDKSFYETPTGARPGAPVHYVNDKASRATTIIMALLVCLLVFQAIDLLKLTCMSWQLDRIEHNTI